MADSCDVHEPLKHERQAFISGMSRLSAIAGLAMLTWVCLGAEISFQRGCRRGLIKL
jgi:hypothetical protein